MGFLGKEMKRRGSLGAQEMPGDRERKQEGQGRREVMHVKD